MPRYNNIVLYIEEIKMLCDGRDISSANTIITGRF